MCCVMSMARIAVYRRRWRNDRRWVEAQIEAGDGRRTAHVTVLAVLSAFDVHAPAAAGRHRPSVTRGSFGSPQTVPVGDQDHGRVPVPTPISRPASVSVRCSRLRYVAVGASASRITARFSPSGATSTVRFRGRT